MCIFNSKINSVNRNDENYIQKSHRPIRTNCKYLNLLLKKQ